MATKKKTAKKEKPRLSLRLESVMRCDYNTLDLFIEKVTGHAFESWSVEEWDRDSYNRYVVNSDMEKWDSVNWEHFKKTGESGSHTLRAILNGLAHEGYIQTGIYLFDTL